ncbi:Quinone oxidoreductase [Klebsiella pneumoniae]|nr:Quinone oxidoreductase [Klebsiella pneumoniae]
MKYIAISQPGGPEVLQIREGEIPTIGEHEVLIEVKAAGVNRPDILQRQGLYPMPEGVTPVPGLEVAGVVVKVGAQVTAFTPGDRVLRADQRRRLCRILRRAGRPDVADPGGPQL